MPISPAIQLKLTTAGVNNAMPAWSIVSDANLQAPAQPPALFGETPAQALTKLMQSFYNYGRLHWTWAQSAGQAAANGGLVKGAINAVACGSFNANFKWLALNGLGITGITDGRETANFLTIPGGTCIDSKWLGNVRSSTEGYQKMKCFKFTGHYWVVYQGLNYDVCYNQTFTSVNQIVWTKLLPPDAKLALKVGMARGLVRMEKPIPSGDHVVLIDQHGPNGWPAYQIVTRAQLLALK